MAEAAVKGPQCQSEAGVNDGKTSTGKERFRCQQCAEGGRTFVRSSASSGCLSPVKQPIVERTLNGRGIREIARVLQVGAKTVLRALKKSHGAVPGHPARRRGGCPEASTGDGRRVEAAEVAEMRRFVPRNAPQRWWWPAIDHVSGVVVASAFGSRAERGFVQLQNLLKPFGLEHCYTEGAGGYERPRPAAVPTIGKATPQPIARKPLTLRTRIKRLTRKTLCFSKSVFLPDTVIGLFGNRYEFRTPISLHPINNLRTRPFIDTSPLAKEKLLAA